MSNKNVTLNDFFCSVKHLFYSKTTVYSTFASVIFKSTNQIQTRNETSEKILSEFPKPDALYNNVRATGDYRNGE